MGQNRLLKKMGVNSNFQASSASQPMGCLLNYIVTACVHLRWWQILANNVFAIVDIFTLEPLVKFREITDWLAHMWCYSNHIVLLYCSI